MKPLAQTDVAALPDPVRKLVERFTSDWEKALRGGPPPSAETFLGELPEADWPVALTALERVEQAFQRRIQVDGVTVDGGTIDLPAKGASDTHPELELTFDSSAETLERPAGPPAEAGSGPAP